MGYQIHDSDDQSGWEALGGAVYGLLWGTIIGIGLGVAFFFLRVPAQARVKWVIVGALLVVALVCSWLLEIGTD